jgi:hypothetical protein
MRINVVVVLQKVTLALAAVAAGDAQEYFIVIIAERQWTSSISLMTKSSVKIALLKIWRR